MGNGRGRSFALSERTPCEPGELPVEKWTVILRAPEGPQIEIVEADAAEWSDDGKSLEFFDMEAIIDVLAALAALASGSKMEIPPEEAKSELTKLFRTFGRVKVASFERDVVIGHFRGLKVDAEVGSLPAILNALSTWHPKLAELLADHMTRGLESKIQIDEMLMSVTKLVEDSLKQTLEEWVGGTVSTTGAQRLLALAERQGFFRKGDSMCDLYRWFFAEPRNTSHHEFAAHPDATVVYWLGCADNLLGDLDTRKKQRTVPFQIAVQPQATGPLHIAVSVPPASNVAPASDVKLEGVLTWPHAARDRIVKSFPLVAAGSGVWTGSYDTRDLPLGSASFSVRGADTRGPFYGSSGTVVTVH